MHGIIIYYTILTLVSVALPFEHIVGMAESPHICQVSTCLQCFVVI